MRLQGILLATALVSAPGERVESQAAAPRRARFCLEERGPELCSMTILLSPSVHAMIGTAGEASFSSGPTADPVRVEHFKPIQYSFSLSLLRDVRAHNAVGGFLQGGLSNKQQIRVAAGARYRWRLGDYRAIEMSPGLLHMQIPGEGSSAEDHEPRVGGTVDVDLHLDHWAILTTRLDVIPTRRTGTAVGLGAGLKMDGSPGGGVGVVLLTGALAVLGYAALFIMASG